MQPRTITYAQVQEFIEAGILMTKRIEEAGIGPEMRKNSPWDGPAGRWNRFLRYVDSMVRDLAYRMYFYLHLESLPHLGLRPVSGTLEISHLHWVEEAGVKRQRPSVFQLFFLRENVVKKGLGARSMFFVLCATKILTDFWGLIALVRLYRGRYGLLFSNAD